MRDTAYLVMNRQGITTLRKNRPNLRSGEVAVRLTVKISDRYFAHDIPEAELEIGDEHVIRPKIDVEVETAPPDLHESSDEQPVSTGPRLEE